MTCPATKPRELKPDQPPPSPSPNGDQSTNLQTPVRGWNNSQLQSSNLATATRLLICRALGKTLRKNLRSLARPLIRPRIRLRTTIPVHHATLSHTTFATRGRATCLFGCRLSSTALDRVSCMGHNGEYPLTSCASDTRRLSIKVSDFLQRLSSPVYLRYNSIEAPPHAHTLHHAVTSTYWPCLPCEVYATVAK